MTDTQNRFATYDNYTYFELRDFCKNRDLETKGTKETLIQRLEKFDLDNEITIDDINDDPYLKQGRLVELQEKLHEILVKSGLNFVVDLNNKCLHLSGGARQAECITLCCPDSVILRTAQTFARPMRPAPSIRKAAYSA